MLWPIIAWVMSAPSGNYILAERALDACKYGKGADPYAVMALLEIEEEAGLPAHARMILPATWCVEASMRNPGNLRGDHGAARGPMQGHGWLWKWCGVKHGAWDDLESAARCYLGRVVAIYERAEKKCPGRGWEVAEAMTANSPRYKWKCDSKSDHWRAKQ